MNNKQDEYAAMLSLEKPIEAGNHRNFDKDVSTLS